MRRLSNWLRRGLCALALALAAAPAAFAQQPSRLYYHVFVRSFADSNGDRIGDLPGLAAHLDYLSSLHVTHILLTPIQASPFYHNYFATDFEGVDPAYGGREGWLAFVRAAHARGMKVILDQEFQYVAEGHPWWRENEGQPGRPEGRFLLWNDPAGQTKPEPLWGQPRLSSWDGKKIGIAMVDLNQPGVRPRFTRLLGDLADPHGDGRLVDGVDGFRIDHMMDDLDSLHRVTNLLAGFWTPLITDLKRINPRLEFIAEQYDWGYGRDFLAEGGADAVFAFPIRQAITKLDKAALTEAVRKTAEATPEGKRQLVFIENHDVDRYASLVGSDPAKLRIGAVLNLTLGGDAIIYYGQELGMRGQKLQDQGSDANDIPQREAFRWRADLEAPGSAIWYQGPHAWWTGRANRSGDGVSVEEEAKDPGSLLSFYRRLTALRAERPELGAGRLEPGCADPGPVFCFTRRLGGAWTFVAVNLSDRAVEADAPRGGRDLMNGGRPSPRRLRLVPWGVAVIGS